MEAEVGWAWTAAGVTGGLLFYGRFLVQWWTSERAGKSVVPPVFWYISLVGAVLLLAYGVRIQSPLATLGYNLNLFIYARNVAFIWRERGWLHGARDRAFHGIFGGIAALALAAMVFTWYREVEVSGGLPPETVRANWFWLAVGLVGQVLFAARMIVQWIVSEKARASVVPTLFWYLSAIASVLQCAAYTQRAEWIFAAGMLLTFAIYLRNIWLIHRVGTAPPAA